MRRVAATLVAAGLMLAAAAAPAMAGQVAGIQTHLLWGDVDDAEMRRQLDLIKDSGAGMTRVDVGWASLQQGGQNGWSSWYLDRLDRMVEAADRRGVELLLTFMNTPCWASTAPESKKQGCEGSWWDRGVTAYPPSDPRDYAEALAFLAARYGDRVAAWEVWNEPNHPDFWRTPDQAGEYAALLKAAYPAVKAAYPAATVVGGSLSQSDHEFTERLYRLGVKGHLDAYAVHPYTDDVSPLDPRPWVDARYSFIRGVPKVREVMQRYGDGSPVWLTESGWSTSTRRGDEHWLNGVSEETQARFMREQAEQVARWPWVEVNIWFNLLDMGGDRANKYLNCGLRRVNGTAKPAWATFRQVAAKLAAPGPGGAEDAAPPSGAAPGGTVQERPAQHRRAGRKKRRASRRRARARARRARARRAARRGMSARAER